MLPGDLSRHPGRPAVRALAGTGGPGQLLRGRTGPRAPSPFSARATAAPASIRQVTGGRTLGVEVRATPAAPAPWSAPPGTVLHVSQVTEVGGLTHVVGEYLRRQVAQGWDVVLASPAGALRDVAEAGGARVLDWAAERSPGRTVPGETRALSHLLDDVRPDVLHLHSSKAGLVGRLAARGRVPTVFSPHAWSFHAVGPRMRPVVTAWERTGARWADVIVCVSARESEEGRAAGVVGAYEVVPNAVDLTRVDGAQLERGRAREQLGVPDGLPLAVCLGRLCPQKGQDVLVEAWGDVREQLPEARLVLVGDGPDRALVERAAAQVDGVVLLGSLGRPESLTWLAAADVVALPSRWEGMSLTVLEAQAVGTPVVASDVAGVRESVRTCDSRVVEPGRADVLAAALVEVLRCRRPEEERPAGLGAAGDGSAVDDAVEHLADVYRRLMRSSTRAR